MPDQDDQEIMNKPDLGVSGLAREMYKQFQIKMKEHVLGNLMAEASELGGKSDMNIFITGPSRSGKSTLGKRLVDDYSGELIDVGQICRLTAPVEDAKQLAMGGLSSRDDRGTEWVNDIIINGLNTDHRVVVVGYPRTPKQFDFLEKYCAEHQHKYKVVCLMSGFKDSLKRDAEGRPDITDTSLLQKGNLFYEFLPKVWTRIDIWATTDVFDRNSMIDLAKRIETKARQE